MLIEDKELISKKIKLERKNANLTQAQLAELIGISPKQLSRIEQGEFIPSLPTFLKVVKILKINIDDLNIEVPYQKSSLKERFIKFISCLSDKEVSLCYAVSKSLVYELNPYKKINK